MRFLLLAFTNLRRHRLRSLIGLAGIAFGVAAMLTVIGVVAGAIGMFERILSADTHYLVFERNVSDLFFSSVTEAQLAAIRAQPEVAAAHPLLFGIVSSPGHPVITCFGLDASDPRLARAHWRSGSADRFGRHAGEAYLGARAAEFLGAAPDGEIVVGHRTFRVGGILELENGFEDGGVFLPLAEAQAFFHRPGVASVVGVQLHDRAAGAGFRAAVEGAHPTLVALENREFSQSYNSFKILNFTAWAVGICAFGLGGLGVANTMLLSVFSRIRELAILRVCGFSRPQVAGLILTEAAAIGAGGVLAGLLLGVGLLHTLEHAPQFQGYVHARIAPLMLLGITLTGLITAIGGALYPARFAAGIQPAEALRYE